jgi:hypothetical protein
VDVVQESPGIDTESSGPARPDSFRRLDGAEQGAIHVEQNGRERAAVEPSIDMSHPACVSEIRA